MELLPSERREALIRSRDIRQAAEQLVRLFEDEEYTDVVTADALIVEVQTATLAIEKVLAEAEAV